MIGSPTFLAVLYTISTAWPVIAFHCPGVREARGKRFAVYPSRGVWCGADQYSAHGRGGLWEVLLHVIDRFHLPETDFKVCNVDGTNAIDAF